MNILITGGLGFIGSNLSKRCVELGHKVTILTKQSYKDYNIRLFKDSVKVIVKDIKEIGEEVQGQDWIFHCASTVDNYNVLDKPYLDAEVNILGTIALLEACKKFNKEAQIIYLSTFFVNGNPSKLPVDPSLKEEPLGIYGATKLAAEQCCKTYSRVFGLKTKVARLSNVFGLGEQTDNNKKAAFNRMIHLAVWDETIKLYDNGKIKRDYIYIDDVVDGLLTIAEKGKISTEQIYYISRGESATMRSLVDIILKESRPFGKVESIEPTKFHKDVGIDDFYCDITPLKELGWQPMVSLEEGIKRVVEVYMKERMNEDK